MYSFKDYLTEHVLSIGLSPKDDAARTHYRQEMHNILRKSYEPVGGYGGLKVGSPEESDKIHKDLSTTFIKATRRNGKITSINLYKNQHGRKSVASGTDGTIQGKKDFIKNKGEDMAQKRAWGEVSGKLFHIMKKVGAPTISNKEAERLTHHDIIKKHLDQSYDRLIGGSPHTKTLVGYPKD